MEPANQKPLPTPTLSSDGADAAKELTRLLEEYCTFSFLRLGDGELRFLLAAQGLETVPDREGLRASCEIAYGTPALAARDYDRLLASFERCSVIDLHGGLPYNQANLGKLRWNRTADSIGTVSSGSTALLFDWIQHELGSYLSRHRSIVCGAEAGLLRELLTNVEYRQLARSYIPDGSEIHFLQPRRDGSRLSEDLEEIKSDLANAVHQHHADTIFVSLGGAAKIVCHELAEEIGIRAIDFGSALRALTYSGSDGQAAWRSSHHPHLFRVPLRIYYPALRSAHPDMPMETLLSKAHAQLCLDLQRKVPLQSITSTANDATMFDASPENLKDFNEDLACYRKEILPLSRSSDEAGRLAAEFDLWRRKHGLGWDGRIFQFAVRMKSLLRAFR